MTRPGWRLLAVGGIAALTAVLTATPALAHVSVDAPGAAQGGYAVLTIRVPTESESASTVGVKLQLPPGQPLASVAVKPHPGWTYTTQRAALKAPIQSDDGEVTEVVSVIDWTASTPSSAIKPGQFDEFEITAGPLPMAPSMTFKVIQSYSDGSQVAWIDEAPPGAAEPEHPAPTLALAAAGAGAGPSGGVSQPGAAGPAATAGTAPSTAPGTAPGTVSGASGGSVAGAYLVGGLGLLAGLAGVALAVAARRRPATVTRSVEQPSARAGTE
jgi:uncharacterized protein YcnI